MSPVDIMTVSVALFALGWNVYRDVIQLPKIKISLSFSLLRKICPSEKENYLKYEISINRMNIQVVNIGRSDIYIKHFIVKKKDQKHPHFFDWKNESQPIKLEPGQEHERERENIHQQLLDGTIERIGFMDTFGRKHWFSRIKLHKVVEKMRNVPTFRYEAQE